MQFYHFQPSEWRDAILSQNDNHEKFCQKAFIVPEDSDTEIVRLLWQVRELQDETKAILLRSLEIDGADDRLIRAEAIVEELEDDLEALENIVFRTGESLKNRYNLGENDSHLPDPALQPEEYAKLRKFILRLPESQKAFDLGISTVGDVLNTAFSMSEERSLAVVRSVTNEDLEDLSPVHHRRASVHEEAFVPFNEVELDDGLDEATLEALQPRHPLADRPGRAATDEANTDIVTQPPRRFALPSAWAFR